jgi:WD40 repeat protein
VAFLPDGLRGLSAGRDKRAMLWDLETGSPLQALEGHSESVSQIAVSKDGRVAATAGKDGLVALWELPA